MSVWCTTLDIDDDGWDDDLSLRAPIAYRLSHVLPSTSDPRGGSLDLASIPAFLTRDGYDDGQEDGAVWPFLRVSLRATEPAEDTIVLDLRQVDALIAELTSWRERVDGGLK